MPVEIQTSSVSHLGDGVQTSFPTTFSFAADVDLTVEVGPAGSPVVQVLGVDYTVLGAGAAEPGGSVEFISGAPADGDVVSITRNTPITQLTNFLTSGPFSAATITRAFDKLTRICQELLRRVQTLEAGTVGSTYTATQVVIASLTPGEPPEGAPFPLTVACGVVPKTLVVGRVENLTTPGEVRFEAAQIPQFSVSGTDAVIPYITGLTPGQQYRITLEVRT